MCVYHKTCFKCSAKPIFFFFPLLLCSLTSLALHASKSSILFGRIQTLGGLLKRKKRQGKDARLSLPLTEVVKSSVLSFQPFGIPRPSSPKPRIRLGKRQANLFLLILILHQSILSLVSLLVLFLFPPLSLSFTLLFVPGSQHRFTLTTYSYLNFMSNSQRLCAAK